MVQLLVGGPQCNCHARKKKWIRVHAHNKRVIACVCLVVHLPVCAHNHVKVTLQRRDVWLAVPPHHPVKHGEQSWGAHRAVGLAPRAPWHHFSATLSTPPPTDTRRLSASLEPWMKCDGGERCHLQGKERQLLTWHLTFIPCEHARIETRAVWPRTHLATRAALALTLCFALLSCRCLDKFHTSVWYSPPISNWVSLFMPILEYLVTEMPKFFFKNPPISKSVLNLRWLWTYAKE